MGEAHFAQPGARIAFVVDWLNDSYQNRVLKGAVEVAQDAGAELVVLPGGVLGAQHAHGVERNALYRLLSPARFDGVVSMTGTLTNAMDLISCGKLFSEFEPSRVCHVAIDVPGSPSVLIDNKRGVRLCIEHLKRVHGRRAIAFVRGPTSNREAEERFTAYCDALEANDLEFRESLVVQGDFRREGGVSAVKTLLDERGFDVGEIDAIVSADDAMALAILEELRRRNIAVPREIAVIGFDDVPEARYAMPPLSTVRQPLIEQGRDAVRAVLAGIAGEPVSSRNTLNTLCCFRRSCGCTAEEAGFLTERPKSDTRLSLSESVARRKAQILDEVLVAAIQLGVPVDEHFSESFFEAVMSAVRGTPQTFRDYFDVLLESVVSRGGNPSGGMDVVSALRRQLSVCAGDDPNQIRQVEGLLHEARILTSEAMDRAQMQRRLGLTSLLCTVADVSSRLSVVGDVDEFREVVFRDIPRMGLGPCLVCCYTDTSMERVRIVAGAGLPKGVVEELSWDEYPASLILPSGLGRDSLPRHIVLQPLCDGHRHWGFAVFSWSETSGHLFEMLKDLLSRSLKRALGA